MKRMKSHLVLIVCLITVVGVLPSAPAQAVVNDIHKIQHVIIIMQENRSFDSYFGTFPGADGIPMQNGVPTVCVNDPKSGQCVKPFHDPRDINQGGPHGATNATKDIDGGKMDGFIQQAEMARKQACKNPDAPGCTGGQQELDSMGYHDAREIPNYWTYAENFVLQDRMFEPNASWSLPQHLFMVSGWSAKCATPGDPMSCENALDGPSGLDTSKNDYAWTDLTYLLHQANVSWAYYLSEGSEPDCEDDAMVCQPKGLKAAVPGIWNPLPAFDTVKKDKLGSELDCAGERGQRASTGACKHGSIVCDRANQCGNARAGVEQYRDFPLLG